MTRWSCTKRNERQQFFARLFDSLCDTYGDPIDGALISEDGIRADWPEYHLEISVPRDLAVTDPDICM